MDNEKLKTQLRDLCIAADGLATAMHLFYANVSSEILDHIIAEAEKENKQHHCGQDAETDNKYAAPKSARELVGMQIIGAFPKFWDCKNCPINGCDKKIELIDGSFLCLAELQQDERPVISFEEEGTNVMVDIKDKTEAFMNYLESVMGKKNASHDKEL